MIFHNNDYGEKGHVEAIQVTFDPAKVTYSELLDVFWRQIDPTDSEGQFVDRGKHYGTTIFFHGEKQKQLAENSKDKLKTQRLFWLLNCKRYTLRTDLLSLESLRLLAVQSGPAYSFATLTC